MRYDAYDIKHIVGLVYRIYGVLLPTIEHIMLKSGAYSGFQFSGGGGVNRGPKGRVYEARRAASGSGVLRQHRPH